VRKLILTGLLGSLLFLTIGTLDATAGLAFADMAICQKILLRPGNDSYPFITGYRCKGFESAEPGVLIDECSCYEATSGDTFSQHGTGEACEFVASCACDGFWDHFNTSKTNFLCAGESEDGVFAHRDHLFFLWIPKIDHHSIFGEGDTANLTCFPDEICKADCEACFQQ
jgi:hypothetical protein